MRWQVKLLKNYAFALLPFPTTLRAIKRKLLPYPTDIDEQTLQQGLLQIEMLRDAGYPLPGKTVLELGTGWKPLIPLLFRLAGCREVILVDSQRLLDRALVAGTAARLVARRDELAARLGLDPEEIRARLTPPEGGDLDDLFRQFGVKYLAPFDARSTKLPDRSVDVVISRAVLEHVPPKIVDELLTEFSRVLRVDGAMCHIIDNSDHWEHHDKRISRVNFLKFADGLWRVITINPLDYQNRLRHFEYVEMLRGHGFEVALDRSEPDRGALEALKSMKICERYRSVPHEALAVLTSFIVASRQPGNRTAPAASREGVLSLQP